jgi:hypothetical protein
MATPHGLGAPFDEQAAFISPGCLKAARYATTRRPRFGENMPAALAFCAARWHIVAAR